MNCSRSSGSDSVLVGVFQSLTNKINVPTAARSMTAPNTRYTVLETLKKLQAPYQMWDSATEMTALSQLTCQICLRKSGFDAVPRAEAEYRPDQEPKTR